MQPMAIFTVDQSVLIFRSGDLFSYDYEIKYTVTGHSHQNMVPQKFVSK